MTARSRDATRTFGTSSPKVIGDAAIRVDALKVRPNGARQEERRHMKVFVVGSRKLLAPRLRFGNRRAVFGSAIRRRAVMQRVNPARILLQMLPADHLRGLVHTSLPPGKTAVLISRTLPLRTIMRGNTWEISSSPTRPVMYSAHLKRPLVTRSNAVRQVAGRVVKTRLQRDVAVVKPDWYPTEPWFPTVALQRSSRRRLCGPYQPPTPTSPAPRPPR